MADLRSALTEALNAAETPDPVVETPVVETSPEAEVETAEAKSARERDEAGRFVAQTPPVETPPVEAPPINRPSTWKKEYWPLYDKLAQGQALTPDEAKKLADYTNQRENEFKGGVSTYKAEADKAKEINEAIAPFLPKLQQYGVKPGAWIASLGRAHEVLAEGSPQDRIAMFKRLAQEYGVPLASLAEGAQMPQQDPTIQWLAQKVQQLDGGFQSIQTLQQQKEQEQIQSSIQAFKSAAGHEHFDVVREQMAGLLQSGMAQDLEDAYSQAIWLNPQTRQAMQAHAQASTVVDRAQEAARAKAKAVSPKSASPSVTTDAKPKGLRASLEQGFDAALGGGRV